MDRNDPAYRGQREYGRILLGLYDPLVIGPIARFVWRCPGSRLLARYRATIRDGHLDVGPGTGYFIAHSGLPPGSRVTILDPNTNVLRHTSSRLRDLEVTAVEADVLKPLPVGGPYRSAALHLVIHCLPGPFDRKQLAVANVAAVLAEDGVLFGASVLGDRAHQTRLSWIVLRLFNRQGGFDNLDDSEDTLYAMLSASFEQVEIDVVGSIALFTATRPTRAHSDPVQVRSTDPTR